MNIIVVLVVVSLVVHAGSGAVAGARRREEWYRPGTSGSFYVENHPYLSISSEMEGWIKEQRDKDSDELEDYPNNPVLKRQSLENKPPHWLFPLLFGSGTARTNLAFRTDNLYLSGFTNGDGEWFSFKTDGQYKIPGSTVLGFRGNYRDLVAGGVGTEGQAWHSLVGLDLRRSAVLNAIATAYGYNPQTTPDAVIKRALATLIVVFMEAQRFPYIRQQVYRAWLSEEEEDGRLDARGAQMVVNWKRISCALRIWDNKSIWNSKEAEMLKEDPPVGLNIDTPEEALAVIGPVLCSESCTQ